MSGERIGLNGEREREGEGKRKGEKERENRHEFVLIIAKSIYLNRKPSISFPTMQPNTAPYLKQSRTGEISVEYEPFRGILEFYDRLSAEGSAILDDIMAKRLTETHRDEF